MRPDSSLWRMSPGAGSGPSLDLLLPGLEDRQKGEPLNQCGGWLVHRAGGTLSLTAKSTVADAISKLFASDNSVTKGMSRYDSAAPMRSRTLMLMKSSAVAPYKPDSQLRKNHVSVQMGPIEA